MVRMVIVPCLSRCDLPGLDSPGLLSKMGKEDGNWPFKWGKLFSCPLPPSCPGWRQWPWNRSPPPAVTVSIGVPRRSARAWRGPRRAHPSRLSPTVLPARFQFPSLSVPTRHLHHHPPCALSVPAGDGPGWSPKPCRVQTHEV